MAISANLERLNYDSADGCIATGTHREVIQSQGSTRTLLAEESGALCVFDRAAGIVFTLPAPVEGMQFDFVVKTSITSNAAKIITNAATVFLTGAVMIGSLTVAESGDVFAGDGSTHVAVSMDGATKGGLKGGRLRFTALSATSWYVEGIAIGAGTLADPFATS